MTVFDSNAGEEGIAIVGMAGRFPQAADIDAFWSILCAAQEGLTHFSRDELRAAGVPSELLDDPRYVPVNGSLADIDLFDADFFRMSPREASLTDPQHRIMLELSWQALENSGYDPEQFRGAIGVYAGCGPSSYLLQNLWPNRTELANVGELSVQMGNNKDYLPTRISYKLNLTGPSISINTACSTSLVAVHSAVQALLDHQCDMALAGGAGIQVPQDIGYLYQEGGILSPDGHCRAFDAKAQGTVSGNGAALVVLKRIADAEADGDHIYAVIRGSAVNNDGANKAGYTAPSVMGQAQVIAEALARAEVDPASIGYIEAHGTGTPLGDPIELAALTQAFAGVGRGEPGCAIGSLKTNFGHLDEAAGVAGLIKAALSLYHRKIPPSLHFETANPEIEFAAGPFYINRELCHWPSSAEGETRRAGVSSFGIGGTNAHLVLEEPPLPKTCAAHRPLHFFPLSALSDTALGQKAADLAAYIENHRELALEDIAFTLQVGRRAFERRAFVVAADADEAVTKLRSPNPQIAVATPGIAPPVVFMCSGQGSQYPAMARGLYEHEPVFRATLDLCFERLRPLLDQNLRDILIPEGVGAEQAAAEALTQTALAQPALFSVQYAMARLLGHWGVEPIAMIGHSLGEYVAACLSGVLDLDSALAVVAARGRLMQSAPHGAMLAVPKSPLQLEEYLDENLELAAINTPDRCTVSGPAEAIASLAARLEAEGCSCQQLRVSHAFHSASMEPILDAFAEELGRHSLNSPKIPYLSNLTGTWIEAEQARDTGTYLRQLREPVRFAEGIEQLIHDFPDAVLLEIGPGQALVDSARRMVPRGSLCLASLLPPRSDEPPHRLLLSTLGTLWQHGVPLNFSTFAESDRRRVPLPGYPFDRQRHWVDAVIPPSDAGNSSRTLVKNSNVTDWFYAPTWRRGRSIPDRRSGKNTEPLYSWLFLADNGGVASGIRDRFRERGDSVVTALPGASFAKLGPETFMVRPDETEDYSAIVDALSDERSRPIRVVHFWTLDRSARSEDRHCGLVRGFNSLIAIAQAVARCKFGTFIEFSLVSTGIEEVTGDEQLSPWAAAALGPIQVIPQELPDFPCRAIDILLPCDEGEQRQNTLDSLMSELIPQDAERMVALRGRYRWIQSFEPVQMARRPEDALDSTDGAARAPVPGRLRHNGVYFITGGLGELGLLLAEYLADRVGARLVLIGRSAFPNRSEWGAMSNVSGSNNAVCRKVTRVMAIERAGGRVLTIQADVTNRDEMTAAYAEAEAEFGKIDGVVHAAGLPGASSYREIRETRLADCDAQFQVKADGLIVLEEIFADRGPDFFLLFSSLSTVLGGLGFAAYAGANHILDAKARRQLGGDFPAWISVNWDAWQVEASSVEAERRGRAITIEEGRKAFEILFDSDIAGQIVVSAGDLQARIARWRDLPSPGQSIRTDSGSVPPRLKQAELGAIHDAPRDSIEEDIAAIWGDLLGLDHVGIHDDFFALRGDSLLAMQVLAQVNRRLESNLSVRTLFESPTVAGLAARLSESSEAVSAKIWPAPLATDYPLTHGQKRLWILSQSPDASVAYNMSYSLRLVGDLDDNALRAAFSYLVARHESLRTAFITREGEPRQAIIDDFEFELPVHELSRERDPVAAAHAAVSEDVLAPFDLTNAPLMRAALLRLSERDHVLMVSLHHIVTDGLSINVLLHELDIAYKAYCGGSVPELLPLDLQYKDFAVWHQHQMQGEQMGAQRRYWLEKLDGELPVLDFPTDRPRVAEQYFDGARVVLNLTSSDQKRIDVLCRDSKVTLFMVLAAALKVLLHHVSGQDDIVIGSPVAGRGQAELEGQIGFYLNNLVLRDQIKRDESFVSFLSRVRMTCVEAFQNQDYPFDCLIEDLAVAVQIGRTPLFDVLLNLMPSEALELRLGDLALESFSDEIKTTVFDLNFMWASGPSGIALELTYNHALFDANTVQGLGESYLKLLKIISADSSLSIRDLCASMEGREASAEKAMFLAEALNLDEDF